MAALRTRILVVALLAAAACAAAGILLRPSSLLTPAEATEPPRHLLVIVVDALRADALSLHGNTRETSPWLERFAQRAVVFERARTQGTYTQASFWSFMTSTHVRTHGWDFHVPGPQPTGGFCGRSDLPTLAEVLGEQGFSSHAVSLNAFLRVDMGFPRGFGIWNGQDVARLERGEGPDPDRQGVQLFRSVGEAVQGWHDGGRHFLYVHTMHTHLPLDPTDDARERFALPEGGVVRVNDARRMEQDGTPEERSLTRELYHAKAWDADRAIRRIVRTLRSEGLLEDTIVVITADHGELLFDHGDRYGHSSGVWQELARVPLLIRAPGLEPARVGRPVALLDLAPTILGQLGLEAAIPDLWQGIDMFDPEGAAAERPVVTERLGQVAISTDGRMEAMRDEEQRWSLYDLDQDPNERSPLVDRLALDELIEVYRGWEDSVPEGQLDQEAEPVGMCRGELAVKKEAQLTEQLRELGYVE